MPDDDAPVVRANLLLAPIASGVRVEILHRRFSVLMRLASGRPVRLIDRG